MFYNFFTLFQAVPAEYQIGLSTMKKISLAVLLCHWLTAVTAQQHYSKAINEQIARVETSLSGGLVIDNYQIVWAAGLGVHGFRYSGGGILITQQMLTDLTKQRYEQYMYEHVFRPLGMNNSCYNQPPAASRRRNLATGYKSNGNEVRQSD
jgi:CubicO group peptidase (beta-lactamase class C family)